MTSRSVAQPIAAGVVTAFVGFASSFAVILKGLTAVGATDAEAASGLMALSIAMGVAGIVLSLASRMPVSAAWSTPGAALLAATGAAPGGFPAAVGAFLVVGLLLISAGLFRPFARLVAAIPGPLANAMLAGVLFGLCLKPIAALIEAPSSATLIVLAWLIVSRWKRTYATPLAALVDGLVIAASGPAAGFDLATITRVPSSLRRRSHWERSSASLHPCSLSPWLRRTFRAWPFSELMATAPIRAGWCGRRAPSAWPRLRSEVMR